MAASEFVKKLVDIAKAQYDQYGNYFETDLQLCNQIKKYWEDLDIPFESCTAVPWSAVFISWCVKQAGANSLEFAFSDAHSEYVYQAIQNATKNQGLFRGHPIEDYKPQIGDIIQYNRDGNNFDFAYASQHKSYESHSVIVTDARKNAEGPYLYAVGGNESNSIRQSRVVLTSQGYLSQRNRHSYICVVQDLK